MNRYLALQQERHELVVEGRQLFDAADAAGRALTAEEAARDDAINARLGEISADLEREERRRERERAQAVAIGGADGARVSGVHDRATDRPWGHELGVRLVAQNDGTQIFGGRPQAFETALGDFARAVASASTPGGSIDPRLLAASGLESASGSEGGFLVGSQMTTQLLERGTSAAVLAPRCTPIALGDGADTLEAPVVDETSRATGSRWGGVRVYRRNEAATVTASHPKFGEWELRVEELMAIAYATDRLLRDATSLGAILSQGFTEEFAFVLDDEIVRGTGVGECEGILNCAALVTTGKETGQAAATILTTNLSKMWMSMPARLRPNAAWFVNQDCEPQLDELTIPAGTGAVEPRFVAYGPDGILRIKGAPVLPIEQAEAVGTPGDIILAALSEYILVTKGGLQADQSLHVRFLYGENTYRWMYAVNGKPKWRSSVTPYKGAATQSPFVALAVRS